MNRRFWSAPIVRLGALLVFAAFEYTGALPQYVAAVAPPPPAPPAPPPTDAELAERLSAPPETRLDVHLTGDGVVDTADPRS